MNWPQQMSRNKASNNGDRYNRPASLPTSSKLEEEQDQRLFGSGERFNPFQAMIRTVIVTTTTTSSVLAATIITCIPVYQLKTNFDTNLCFNLKFRVISS